MESVLWLSAQGLVLVGLVVGLVIYSRTRRRTAGWTPAAPRSPGAGEWNAKIVTGLVDGVYGLMRIDAGTLTFLPDAPGPDSPPWSLPCTTVTVRTVPAASFHTANVELSWPRGSLRVMVSREHINRFSRNTLKTLRQSAWADEFAAALVASGARRA